MIPFFSKAHGQVLPFMRVLCEQCVTNGARKKFWHKSTHKTKHSTTMARSSVVLLVILLVAALVLCQQVKIDATGNTLPTAPQFKANAGIDLKDPMTSFSTVEDVFDHYIPEPYLTQVKRVLYGKPVQSVPIATAIQQLADSNNFDVKYFNMSHLAAKEHTRKARRVKIGVIQNGIAKPTNESVEVQYQAIQDKIEKMIDAAGALGVNVLGLQEAWTMPFAFCTREKQPWLEYVLRIMNHNMFVDLQKMQKLVEAPNLLNAWPKRYVHKKHEYNLDSTTWSLLAAFWNAIPSMLIPFGTLLLLLVTMVTILASIARIIFLVLVTLTKPRT